VRTKAVEKVSAELRLRAEMAETVPKAQLARLEQLRTQVLASTDWLPIY
jgi:hypothetical protein